MNREAIPALGAAEGQGEPKPTLGIASGPCAWLALVLPLGFGIWSLSGEAAWRDDPAIVRDLGFVPVGLEGAVSTVATQLLALVPLGGLVLRASLLGVLALALSSRLFFGALLGVLDRRFATPLNPLLALFASALWSLCPAVQEQAAHIGGPLPAVALVLAALRLASEAFELGDRRSFAATGLCWGAALAESHAAGVLLALWIAGQLASAGGRRFLPELGRVLGAGAGAFVLLSSLRLPRPGRPALASYTDLLRDGTDAPFARLALGHGLVERWVADIGVAPLVLAALGAALALSIEPLRRRCTAWALLAGAGALAGLWPAAPGTLALLAVSSSLGVIAFFPIAVQALVRCLWASALPFARPAAVLSVSFAATLVLARADRLALLAAPGSGAATWAEEALGRLPPESLVLMRTPELSFRALASRFLHGTRPDVVIVPSLLLSAQALQRDAAFADPELAPLLRQLWVNGSADEYSLCRLADDRPVFAELDTRWDRRVLEHLRPDGLWLGFSAPALGGSERRSGVDRTRAVLRRALALSGGIEGMDAATRRVLGTAAAEQASVLATLGDPTASARLLHAARRIDRQNPLGRQLAARSAAAAQARLAAGDLSR